MTDPNETKLPEEHGGDLRVYSRLLSYVVPLWPYFAISVAGYFIYSVSNVAFVQLISYIVDSLEGTDPLVDSSYGDVIRSMVGDGDALNRTVIPLAMVIIVLLRGMGTFVGNYFMARVSTSVVHQLRVELFDQLLKLPSKFYDRNALGHLVAKVTFHVTQVTGAATDAVRVLIREGFTVIMYLSFLLWLNWKLTLIFFTVAPFIALLVGFAGRRFRKISERIQNSMGDVTHVASETVQGYRVVRIFGGKNYEQERFEKVSNYNRHQSMKMVVTASISTPIIQLLVASALAVLVWFVLDPRLLADMTAGKVIAFITTGGLLAKPIRQLSEINETIQKGLAAAQDIFNLFDEEIEQDTGTIKLQEVEGRIEFRNVSFAYDDHGPKVLDDVSFTAQPGETIALVGRSGSGKSTLASLIPRFYSPGSGQILLDGHPLDSIQLGNLRDQISVVTQQVTLFNDTVASNIAYGKLKSCSRDDIEDAARRAYAWDFVEHLDQQLDTLVGDDGVLLSGGQRQRLAIARAFLKDAPILILDEATSALDSESESYIQAALEDVIKDRTTIVIAHRLSTIEKADRILVIEDGRIIEEGTHDQLLAAGGHYANLHRFADDAVAHDANPAVPLDAGVFDTDEHESQFSLFSEDFNPLLKAWYSDAAWVKVLTPVSYIYQWLSERRRRSIERHPERQYQAEVPVIVVGNINVGGTGKSPLVIWLAQQLLEAGYSPGIVSRGYGGKAEQYPLEVTASSDPAEVGDEAVMIARRSSCPVVVDPDRTRAVQYLLDNSTTDIVISDDGLQHYALGRQVEIAVLDGARGLGNGLCLPAGPLRERPERLKEVDFVVVNGEEQHDRKKKLPDCHRIAMQLEPVSWVNIHTGDEVPVDEWEGSKLVHGIAGIGHPERFFRTLEETGLTVLRHAFEDHHQFRNSDLLFGDNLPVVMTEKDAVKCRLLNSELIHSDYWYLKVDVTMEAGFFDQLTRRLNQETLQNVG